eukprot:CAMPEP_0179413010 /NCGR_PEP_ID=MMETSP0799-20121207/4825_1 /TAXON_ID=46947 /ORGANISM="Geminigera cryophila, Strain CCMP2564" /LENGTH=127 /DNA_ID=CAMNT_0021185363 /DNA_START=47 /DNA_END=426 /DNA_ORIENTATION=+
MARTAATAAKSKSKCGNAEGPAGYVIEQECPELDTAQQQKTLVGKTVLHAWDNATAVGWFKGTVVAGKEKITKKESEAIPRANFVVQYKRSETGVNGLHGLVACDLSERTFGTDQWWVILSEVPQGG